MEGVQELLNEHQTKSLAILETETISPNDTGLFVHGPIGDNKYPLKKIKNFKEKMEKGNGDKADISFFKFCYVDMMADQDAGTIFTSYREMMEKMKQQFTDTIFVHVTVPLTVVQTGWKVPIKRFIGKAPGGFLDNIVRNRYNHLLKATYSKKDPIFDLAAIESTSPTDQETVFEWDGQQYNSLYPGYSSDGRHLDKDGQRHVALKLLSFLASLG